MADTSEPDYQQVLTHLRNGDWEAAHVMVQEEESATGCWAHAIVHLMEGDLGNAGYWYRRAGRPAAGLDTIDGEITAFAESLS